MPVTPQPTEKSAVRSSSSHHPRTRPFFPSFHNFPSFHRIAARHRGNPCFVQCHAASTKFQCWILLAEVKCRSPDGRLSEAVARAQRESELGSMPGLLNTRWLSKPILLETRSVGIPRSPNRTAAKKTTGKQQIFANCGFENGYRSDIRRSATSGSKRVEALSKGPQQCRTDQPNPSSKQSHDNHALAK